MKSITSFWGSGTFSGPAAAAPTTETAASASVTLVNTNLNFMTTLRDEQLGNRLSHFVSSRAPAIDRHAHSRLRFENDFRDGIAASSHMETRVNASAGKPRQHERQ